MPEHRVLFCTSEVFPLIKTGGLADVSGGLPHALHKIGTDIRITLPAYRSVLASLTRPSKLLIETRIQDWSVKLWQTVLPGSRVPVWLVDCPALFDRPGNPYLDEQGLAWPDNATRFAVFSRMVCHIAMNRCGLNWQPHVVHCNDWQTGLVPALLEQESKRPATVFTIHNLAYQGLFDRTTFESLELPETFWHFERLEFHNQISFIKGGLVYADRINTVSPNYAKEIQTPEFGNGLDGILSYRHSRLSGILNGIDTDVWNPGTDRLIVKKYNHLHIQNKAANKQALLETAGLPHKPDVMLVGLISRLAEQKGIDLLLDIMPELVQRPVQLMVLGSGNKTYEQSLQKAAQTWPENIAMFKGYDESLAHRIEAGADVFLMPSRFEPCGLNQMYSQRYGTLPVVTPVCGLVDTVMDVSDEKRGTGFMMQDVSAQALLESIDRAIEMYQDSGRWKYHMKKAMQQDFSWRKSAAAYQQLYQQARRENPRPDH